MQYRNNIISPILHAQSNSNKIKLHENLDTIMAYIRQRIHELQRTEQNRHKLEALRSISSSVCEFIHCWMEDDDDESK